MIRRGPQERRLVEQNGMPLRELLLRDLNLGLLQQQMAKLYGVSESTVSYWIMREKVKRRVTWA